MNKLTTFIITSLKKSFPNASQMLKSNIIVWKEGLRARKFYIPAAEVGMLVKARAWAYALLYIIVFDVILFFFYRIVRKFIMPMTVGCAVHLGDYNKDRVRLGSISWDLPEGVREACGYASETFSNLLGGGKPIAPAVKSNIFLDILTNFSNFCLEHWKFIIGFS